MQTLVTQVQPGATARIQSSSTALSTSRAPALAARHDQDVEARRVGEGVVGEHPQPLRAPDRLERLGDR